MIGTSTSFYGYGDKSIEIKIEKLINIFSECGMTPYIQIGAGKSNMEYNELIKTLNRFRKESGVIFTIHQSIWLPSDDFYINIASSDEKIRNLSIKCIKKNIDFAKDIEAKNVSFHGGYATKILTQLKEFAPLTAHAEVSYEEAYNNSNESLEELKDYAKNDIQLSIENFNYRPERRYMFSRVNDFNNLPTGIGIILNVGHLYYTEKRIEDNNYIKKMIDVLKDKIYEMHLNDNDGTEDLHMLIGDGNIPIKEIIKQVSQDKEMPHLIIEAHKTRHKYSDNDLKNNIIKLKKIVKDM